MDVVFEMAGGRVFDESLAALAPFGRLVAYGIASREQNEVTNGRLLRKSQAVVGFWLMHCLGRREMMEEPLADLFERAARGELDAACWAPPTHSPRCGAPTRTSRRGAPRASSCSTRRA